MAVALLVLGSVIVYLLARFATVNTGAALVGLYLVVMAGVLAGLGALSVRHRAGTPMTTAALFVVALLATPIFAVAGTMGVSDRAQAALGNLFGDDDTADVVAEPESVLPEPEAGSDEAEPEPPVADLSDEQQAAFEFLSAAVANAPLTGLAAPGSPAAEYAAYRDVASRAEVQSFEEAPVVTNQDESVLLTYFGEVDIEFSGFVVTDGLLADFTREGTPIGDLVHQDLGSGELGGGGAIEYQHLFINEDGVYIAGEMEAGESPVSYGSAVYVGPDKAQIDGEWSAESETAPGARTPFSVFIPGAVSGGRVTLSAYDNDSFDSVETEITIP